MNYNKVYYFYIVAQTLNFTLAARRLYISQSAVSRHMKELEDDFGTQLFVRTNRNLILTKAGEALYSEASRMFSNEEEIYQKVRTAAFTDEPKLRIGFMGIRPSFHLPSITNILLQKYPQLSVTLRRYNWDNIIPALKSNMIDVGLRLRLGEKTEPEFKHFVIDNTIPAMVVQKNHPLAGKKKANISEFCNDNFLVLSKEDNIIPNTYTEKIFKNNNFVPKSYTEYNQAETILMLIHSMGGVSLLSSFAAIDQFPDLRIVELENLDTIYLELVWSEPLDNEKIVLEFANTLKQFWDSKK